MAILAFFGSVAQVVLSRLWDPVVSHVGYLIRVDENVAKLSNEIENLEARRTRINKQIEIAERKQQTCNPEVRLWLQRAESIETEAKAIINDEYTSSSSIVDCSLKCWSRYRVSRRAAKKLIEVVEVHDSGTFENVGIELLPSPVEENPATSTVRGGMGSNLHRVLGCLQEDKVGIVGIWGMGGVGKTTLLKEINNHFLGGFEQGLRFDHVMYLVASKGCQPKQLQTDLAEKLGLFLKPGSETKSQADSIFKFLNRRKFLLLLDDLWEPLNLEEIGIPHPNGPRKQKIVLATRSESVCGCMEARPLIKVECLEPGEAWKLFKEKVGEDVVYSDIRIERLAKEVAKECHGLPLALITIGRAMSTKRTWQEWEHAITWLKNPYFSEISGLEFLSPLHAKLKLSYDSLQEDMKQCFLCCSMWPEGYSIWKIELINCWMGLGLLDIYATIDETYNRGFFIIERLKEACLLEPGDIKDREVKVHGVIREMALWIASGCGEKPMKWIVQAGVGLKKVPKMDTQKVEGLSLMCNYIEELPKNLDCPSLLFLSLQQNFNLKIIPPAFFQRLIILTFLDLSWVPIKELPREIGLLVELRYLNLSQTDIISLPMELANLTKLRYLLLTYMDHLKKIPSGVISSLSLLQELNLYGTKYAGHEVEHVVVTDPLPPSRNEGEEFSIEELSCLGGGPYALGITVKRVTTLQRIYKTPVVLRLLGLYGLEGEETLRLDVQASLKILNIRECSSLKDLLIIEDKDSWIRTDVCNYLPKLEYLTVWDVPNLGRINLVGQFLNLSGLTIGRNYKLRDLTWVLKLPNLVLLDLSYCYEMAHVIDNIEDGSGGTEVMKELRKLKILQLNHLPSLVTVSDGPLAFPSLEYIDVFGCPLLKKLPFGLETTNVNALRQIRCERKWWEGLEWQNEYIRDSLLPFFKEFEYNPLRPDLATDPTCLSLRAFFTHRQPLMHIAFGSNSHALSIFTAQMSQL